jgi:hypothetical protein
LRDLLLTLPIGYYMIGLKADPRDAGRRWRVVVR